MTSPAPIAAPDVLRYVDAFGVAWLRGRFWIVAGSPLLPAQCLSATLLSRYVEPHPLPPTPEDVEHLISELEPAILPAQRFRFIIQSTILRATAREYYAA